MDFFTAHQLLWLLRAERPLEAQHADLMHLLLLQAAAQGTLAEGTCITPADVMATALRQSERNVRRLRQQLKDWGYLSPGSAPNQWQLGLVSLAKTLRLPIPGEQPAPARALPARRPPAARPLPAVVPPAPVPALILTPAPSAPAARPLRVVDAEEVGDLLAKRPLIVNGSGVKLRYEESGQAATPSQIADLGDFEAWLAEEAPKMLRFKTLKGKHAITAHQLTELYRKFSPKLLAYKLRALENKPDTLKKYDNAYLTLSNWCSMELARAGQVWQTMPDENPLPVSLRFLLDEKRNTPAISGNLFAQGSPEPTEYADARSRDAARNSMFNWGGN